MIFILPNGTEIEATYEGGMWVADCTFESIGTYVITAKVNQTIFLLNNSYYSLANTFNGTTIVKNSTYNLDVSVVPGVDGNDTKVTVTVPENVTGDVSVNVNGTVYPAVKVNDTTYEVVVPLAPGNYTVNATVSDDPKYADKTSDNKEIIVEMVYKVESKDMKRGWDSPYDYQAKLVDINGKPVKDQTLTFTINGKDYNATTDSNGIARLTTSKLAVGVYSVTITNPMNGKKTTQKITIVKRLFENKDLTKDFVDSNHYKVLAIGDDGNHVGAGQTVVMKVNGKTYKIKTDKNGYATLPIKLNPRKYTITANYHKTTVKNKIVVKQTLKLAKKVVSVKKGKKLVLKATLKWSNGKAIKGKVIKFKFKGKTYKAKTDKKGIAKVTIKPKVANKLKKGKKYNYSATYITNIVIGNVKIK